MSAFLLFQIGFNKCATTALASLFSRAGIRSLHSGGRKWRRIGHPAIAGRNPQLDIQTNIREGRPPIEGLEDFGAFFDMEFAQRLELIENFREYRAFARAYPHARFMLNTRDREDWLRSRIRHKDGMYLGRAMKRMGKDRDAVLQFWADDFDRHHAEVREFFAAESDRLLVFDIDCDHVRKIVRFARPEVSLNPRHWRRIRVTDEVAEANDWSDADAPG